MRPLRGRAVILKWQQATKKLTPEGADKAAETLNSSCLYRVGNIILSRYFALKWSQKGGGYTVLIRISGGNHFGAEDYFPFFQAEVTAVDYP